MACECAVACQSWTKQPLQELGEKQLYVLMGGVSVVLFMLLGAGDMLMSYHSTYSNTCYTITNNSDGTSLSTLLLTVLLGPCCAIMTVFW